ncbi:MAG: hypothetical protein RMK99_14515 [Anaerolineales bacterium]|nr:hypothetical protein [Anaerolineales bacterium]
MSRQTALIITAITALLCGCPGLGACLWGAAFGIGGAFGNASFTIGSETSQLDPMTSLLIGGGVICLGLLLILIPVAVGFFTLRQKPGTTA